MITENTNNYSIERRYKRAPLSCQVGFFLDGDYRFANAVKVSAGGMLMRSGVRLAQGEHLEVHFYVTSEHFVSVKAEVAYVMPDQTDETSSLVGLRFMDISARNFAAIEGYVKKHL